MESSSVYFLISYDYRSNDNNESINDNEAVNFLKNEGFSCTAGYWGCPWYFVDIEKKIFKPGRPGVGYGRVIGEHAITLDEFKTIYSIYKKYKGLSYFKFE